MTNQSLTPSAFPDCRWAYDIHRPDLRGCSSPKLNGTGFGVDLNQCTNCYCRDHEPAQPRPDVNWSPVIGITTATHIRQESKTLESLFTGNDGNFLDLSILSYVFDDKTFQIGAWPHFLVSLQTLVHKHPDASHYIMLQDDVVFSRNVFDYIRDKIDIPHNAGVVSLFCPAEYHPNRYRNNGRAGLLQIPCGYHLAGAQAYLFPAERAWDFLQTKWVINHRRNPPKGGPFKGTGVHHIDGVVGEYCAISGFKPYYHWPSLSQHVGHNSTLYSDATLTNRRRSADSFLGVNFDLLNPHVTAVTITRNKRPALLAQAIRHFEDQTYPNKSLLIINDGEPIPDHPNDSVKIINLPDENRSVGDLRNMSADILRNSNSLIIQWDDDDLYHPERIARQVSIWRPGCCVVLQSQKLYDATTKTESVKVRERGIEGTILYDPVTCPVRQDTTKGEDTKFYLDYPPARRIILKGEPHLYTRVYHGQNTFDRDHVMSSS